jgi:hypothetical protein
MGYKMQRLASFCSRQADIDINASLFLSQKRATAFFISSVC